MHTCVRVGMYLCVCNSMLEAIIPPNTSQTRTHVSTLTLCLSLQVQDELPKPPTPGMVESNLGIYSPRIVLLLRWIESFLSSAVLSAAHPDRNRFILSVMELTRMCVLFGFYSSPDAMARIAGVVTRLIDEAKDEEGNTCKAHTRGEHEITATLFQSLQLLHYCCNQQVRDRLVHLIAFFKETRGSALLSRLKKLPMIDSHLGSVTQDWSKVSAIIKRINYIDQQGALSEVLTDVALSPSRKIMLSALDLLNRLNSSQSNTLVLLADAQVHAVCMLCA
jgi:hypothetical protein